MSIASVLADGRLIRQEWAREEDGRLLLCLYTAMADDPDARPQTCPASLCPRWLAYLLPWMDDAGTDEAWPDMAARVARLAPQFHRLRPHVEWQVRAACVREAMRHTTDPQSLAVCKTVGEHVGDEETASLAAARAAARAEAEAEEASLAAARAAARAKAAEAEAEAEAEAAAADHLTTTILDLIEADLAATEETR